jgi:hypothetical protein
MVVPAHLCGKPAAPEFLLVAILGVSVMPMQVMAMAVPIIAPTMFVPLPIRLLMA